MAIGTTPTKADARFEFHRGVTPLVIWGARARTPRWPAEVGPDTGRQAEVGNSLGWSPSVNYVTQYHGNPKHVGSSH